MDFCPAAAGGIDIIDRGAVLRIGFEDCVRYHGRSSIGGVALGFRLMQRALAELCPGGALAPEEAARFQEMKEGLAQAALSMPLDRLFRAVEARRVG